MCVALSAVALLAGMNGYAQKKQMAQKAMEALTGGVPSAFSKVAPVALSNGAVTGSRIALAQFTLADSKYMSSTELFNRVNASRAFAAMPVTEVKALEVKFANLDGEVLAQPQAGYVPVLWNMEPAVAPEVLGNTQVYAMTDLLNIQQYMKAHNDEFPQIFSVLEGGWLTVTDCLNSPEGNRAFLGVVSILVKEAVGQASPAVVHQLVTLYAGARNQVSVPDIARGLEDWRSANPGADAPKLPTDMDGISLRANPESLWLAVQIRLLQLTPGLELPEVLCTANVLAR